MYDLMKPDLLVHPLYYKSILDYNLHEIYNILRLEDLQLDIEFQPKYITTNGVVSLQNVKLDNYYTKKLEKKSGIKPQYTSYNIKNNTPIYTIEQNGPRYIIWPQNDVLTVCATYIDRINDYQLYQACIRARQWAANIMKFKSIIVFDLDLTLIDDDGRKLKYSDDLLQLAREKYDYLVLYSHGSHLHVDEHIQQFENWHSENSICSQTTSSTTNSSNNGKLFDLILSNSDHNARSNKNLLFLYNYFPNTRFTKAILVDDSLYNWTPEYTDFIVPAPQTSLYHILPLI